MCFSSVLLPEPLPPMIAKMLRRRTRNETSRCTTWSPNAIVRFSTAMHGGVAAASVISDAEHMGADRENRVDQDDAENADHDGARCGAPDIRRAAARLQADVTADDRNQRAETEALEPADDELVRADREACLLDIGPASHVEHAGRDHEAAENPDCTGEYVQKRHDDRQRKH